MGSHKETVYLLGKEMMSFRISDISLSLTLAGGQPVASQNTLVWASRIQALLFHT